MKNILKITSLLLLVISVPTSSAFALGFGYNDPLPVQIVTPFGTDPNQGVVNGLNGVSDAINAQTQAIKDAQAQQQIAARNPECARSLTAYIREHDVSLNQIDKMINDYLAANSNNSDPQAAQLSAAHLNHLYTLRGAQNQRYIDYINSACSYAVLNASCVKSNGPNSEMASYDEKIGAAQCKCSSGYVWNSSACVVQQAQQTAPASSIQCNGKSWNACPAGQNFYCPATGDAQCLPNQQAVTKTSAPKQVESNTCATGSIYIEAKKACMTNDAYCVWNGYGVHSHWDGTPPPSWPGVPTCICDVGFTYKSPTFRKGTYTLVPGSCVANQPKVIIKPAITTVHEVSSTTEIKAVVAQNNQPTPPAPRRGVWSWFKGLFGF